MDDDDDDDFFPRPRGFGMISSVASFGGGFSLCLGSDYESPRPAARRRCDYCGLPHSGAARCDGCGAPTYQGPTRVWRARPREGQ